MISSSSRAVSFVGFLLGCTLGSTDLDHCSDPVGVLAELVLVVWLIVHFSSQHYIRRLVRTQNAIFVVAVPSILGSAS